jgi:hypothetical protein
MNAKNHAALVDALRAANREDYQLPDEHHVFTDLAEHLARVGGCLCPQGVLTRFDVLAIWQAASHGDPDLVEDVLRQIARGERQPLTKPPNNRTGQRPSGDADPSVA